MSNVGFVKLVSTMGSDDSIVDAARVSYNGSGKSSTEKLLRYLIKHKHTSPFEMGSMIFHLKMPIFVARQWHRHRTANINEISARYTVIKDEFYYPETIYSQSKTNKQGSGDKIESDFIFKMKYTCGLAYNYYEQALEDGVSREIARMILPQNIFTEFYWKMDLNNLMHFLRLRLGEGAQYEIRVLANEVLNVMTKEFPIISKIFGEELCCATNK